MRPPSRRSFPAWSRAAGGPPGPQSTSASGGHLGSVSARYRYTLQPHIEKALYNNWVTVSISGHRYNNNIIITLFMLQLLKTENQGKTNGTEKYKIQNIEQQTNWISGTKELHKRTTSLFLFFLMVYLIRDSAHWSKHCSKCARVSQEAIFHL